jgi:hypothetical protein
VSDGEVLTADGPFADAKEHLGDFYIIEVNDLDPALARGRRPPQQSRSRSRSGRSDTYPRPDTLHDIDAVPRIDEAAVGQIFREESGRSIAALGTSSR